MDNQSRAFSLLLENPVNLQAAALALIMDFVLDDEMIEGRPEFWKARAWRDLIDIDGGS
jgi:hypothetical protein